MKLFKHIAAATAALMLLTSCSVLKSVASSALSAGSSTGTAISALYNIFKLTGGIDLSNLTNIINLGKILTGAKSLANATTAYTDDFASGLISGSSNLVNADNVASVLSTLKALTNIDTSAITNAASSYAATGTATPVSASNAGASETVSALTSLFKTLK
jgi:hypothetical protein